MDIDQESGNNRTRNMPCTAYIWQLWPALSTECWAPRSLALLGRSWPGETTNVQLTWTVFGQRGSGVNPQVRCRTSERQRSLRGCWRLSEAKERWRELRWDETDADSNGCGINCLSTYKLLTIYCSPQGGHAVQYWAENGCAVSDKFWPLSENSWKLLATLGKCWQHWGHSPARFQHWSQPSHNQLGTLGVTTS